jgi:hypothetical protein
MFKEQPGLIELIITPETGEQKANYKEAYAEE